MIAYPKIDPVLIDLGSLALPVFGEVGPFQIRWYGLMYVFGFIIAISLVRYQLKMEKFKSFISHEENLNFILILSLVLGGRMGYVLFYKFSYFLDHPFEIFATWHGGMSFHGALIGMLLGGWLFCRKHDLDFLKGADLYIVTTPIGIGLGRIGNFINAELIGRHSNAPWAMIFPGGGPYSRHPSQLYECFLEGICLFCILWKLKNRPLGSGSTLAFFLIFYGIFRFCVEFFREPDSHLGLIISFLSMGQILSTVMILSGAALFYWQNNVEN
jgi:phosphatidylglycerol---prolipoprotein diacylglyceryl transferase